MRITSESYAPSPTASPTRKGESRADERQQAPHQSGAQPSNSQGTTQPQFFKTASGRSTNVEMPRMASPTPEIIPVEPLHQRLVEKFFEAPAPVDPLKKNGRLYVALVLCLFGFTAVIGKLVKIQVLDHEELSQQAQQQYRTLVPIKAKRGVIRDRNGVILASNEYVVKFAVDPRSLKDPKRVAKQFAAVFGKPEATYLEIFKDTARRYIVLEREVPLEVAQKLDSLKDKGIIREMESRRHYAFGERAAHLIGFASKDGRGLAGIELIDNRALAGESGFTIMQRDGRGAKRPDVDYDRVEPRDGEDITLTIDEAIQSLTESALKAGVQKANAMAGIAIVMRPSTGEILGLANAPDFNPNEFGMASGDMLRNRAITDAFEPGSTIKVLTAAMALEEGVYKPNDLINAEGGTWSIEGGAKIRDTHPYGTLTFRAALEKSSNVCFAKISDRIDKKRFYKYLRDFGFGVLSGVDVPGEVRGFIRKPERWGPNSKRYMAFGYELTNTCLQMASAYATIANYGLMMKPRVVLSRTTSDGEVIENRPQEIRRVVSEETARTLIGIMQGVVDSGTGTTARIKGVAVAGKTGTAQQLVNGRYSKEHYTSSFTGFFPAEKPEYMVLVILRSPRNGYYGGAVSAPIFREIAMRLLEMDGKLPPEARSTKPETPAVDDNSSIEIEGTVINARERVEERELPDVRGLPTDAAKSLYASLGFAVVQSGTGTVERVERISGDSVRFHLQPKSNDGARLPGDGKVPDFSGMPMSRAIKFGALQGFRTKIVGAGAVKDQFPKPGAPVDRRNPMITLFGDE